MKKKILGFLLFNSLSIFLNGQGFILQSQLVHEKLAFDKVDRVSLIYANSNESCFIKNGDSLSIVLESADSLRFKLLPPPQKIPDYYYDECATLKYGDTMVYVHENAVYFQNLEDRSIIKKLEMKSNFVFTPMYSFQDAANIYLFSFYNNNSRTDLGHDLVYFYKISKKEKKILIKQHLDFGKEILLAPLSFQSLAMNSKGFVVSSTIKNELYRFDLNFKAIDTIRLDERVGKKNLKKFNSSFPDAGVKNYLHNAKQVIYDFEQKDLFDQKNIFKIFFVNDTTLLINYMSKKYGEFETVFYSIDQQKVVGSFSPKFRYNQFSPLCWTKRIYKNPDGFIVMVNTEERNDQLYYVINKYVYSPEIRLKRKALNDLLENYQKEVELKNVSGVLLVDKYYCKACARDIGKGVLVILEVSDDMLDVNKRALLKKSKREYKAKGQILLLTKKEIIKIGKGLKLNTVHPIN